MMNKFNNNKQRTYGPDVFCFIVRQICTNFSLTNHSHFDSKHIIYKNSESFSASDDLLYYISHLRHPKSSSHLGGSHVYVHNRKNSCMKPEPARLFESSEQQRRFAAPTR